ncbi:MAG: PhnD/SsuA/transferrin family substrate-binding protein [Kofleriaceae bacterium]
MKSIVKSVVMAILCTLVAVGRAEPLTVGLFAPTAPFASTASRVELATKLGEQFGKALGVAGNGKVFARAGDFASAVKSGEVTVALVDATYLATVGGSYTMLGDAVRGGETRHAWILVARGITKIADLRGKRVLVPAIGGREVDFVTNVLFGGEVGKDFFAKIVPAPDTASALAALGLGKADAAIVPSGVELPAGTTQLLELPALSGPVLVAYGTLSPARLAALVKAAVGFQGDATVTALRDADPDAIRTIMQRFAAVVRRGPWAVPAVRLLVVDLVEGRTFSIDRTSAAAFAAAPGR